MLDVIKKWRCHDNLAVTVNDNAPWIRVQLIGKDLLLLYKKWLNLNFVEVLDQEAGEHLWFQGRSSSATVLSQPLIFISVFLQVYNSASAY